MSAMPRALVTGADGQLGKELKKTLPFDIDVHWTDLAQLDITNSNLVDLYVNELAPAFIINAAAFTAVDDAESAKESAYRVNHNGVANLANAAVMMNAKFLHISTDYVFEGKGSLYQPNDPVSPISVYGESKSLGEVDALNSGANVTVVRTAWLYSAYGNNFVKTILKLIRENDSLNVVTDQIGTPTWAKGLAQFIWSAVVTESPFNGIVHYTDSGVASWYDFAVAIQEEAIAIGLLKKSISLNPIVTAQFPTFAKRPSFVVLDKHSSIALVGAAPHWRVQLRAMLKELKEIG